MTNVCGDPDSYDVICSSMISAILNGDIRAVKCGIEKHRLSYCKEWRDGYDLLKKALLHHRCDVAALLLAYGARVNYGESSIRETTPLHIAAHNHSHHKILEMLLSSGASVDKQDEFGNTPMHYYELKMCYSLDNQEVVLCSDYYSNVNTVNRRGETPLHIAVKKGQLEIALVLINMGASVDIGDHRGVTPLHLVAYCERSFGINVFDNSRSHITRLVVPHSCNVNAANLDGDTPLHIAFKCHNEECIELLLEANASVDVSNNFGLTPLHYAAAGLSEFFNDVSCRKRIVEVVVSRSLNVNALSKAGDTPLDIALKYGFDNKEVLSLLLKRGAKIGETCNATSKNDETCNATNKNDETWNTPWDIALKYGFGNKEVLSLLLKRGAKNDETCNATSKNDETCNATNKNDETWNATNKNDETWNATNKNDETCNATLKSGATCFHSKIKRLIWEKVDELLRENAVFDPIDQSGSSPLHIKAKSLREENAELLSSVNVANKGGETALHVTVQESNLICTTFLWALGADLNVCDNAGNSPLHMAVEGTDLECVRFLLSKGATADKRNCSGLTPLHLAAVDRRTIDIAKLLVPHSSVNARNDEGETALHIAVHNINKECVKLLLSNDASVEVVDKRGSTPLHYAADQCKVDLADLLLLHSANVNAANNIGETPLHVSAKGRGNIVELLLRRDAAIDARDRAGSTPLHYAAECNDHQCAELIIAHNAASVNATNNCGEIPLHVAIKNSKYESIPSSSVNDNGRGRRAFIEGEKRFIQFITFLLDHGANINAKNHDGATALSLAVAKAYVKVVETLLKCGADVEVCVENETGMTVLHHALGKSHRADIQALLECGSSDGEWVQNAAFGYDVQLRREMVKMLVGKGCDVNTKTHKNVTPLHFSAAQRDTCISELLLRNGANVNAVCDTKQLTPLHVAVLVGCETMVSFLLEHGASVDAVDEDGNTALYKAVTLERAFVSDLVGCILLKHSPKKSIECNRKCLEAAVECGAHDIDSRRLIDKLLECGFKIQAHDDVMLLHVAVRKGYTTFVEEMFKCSSDSLSLINSMSGEHLMTALHVAAKHSLHKMVEYLLAAGADVNVKDGKNNTSLFYTSNEKVAMLLLDHNAKSEKCPDIFFTAAKRRHNKSTLLVRRLLESGVDVNANDSDGNTALMLACRNCNYTTVELLLQCNADVNVKDNKTGLTALHFAVSLDNLRDVCYSRKSLDNDSWETGNFYEYVISTRVYDVEYANDRNNEGKKLVLTEAVQCGIKKNIEVLLSYGADINIKCGDFTPLMWAEKVYSSITSAEDVRTEERRFLDDNFHDHPAYRGDDDYDYDGDYEFDENVSIYRFPPEFFPNSVYMSIEYLFQEHIQRMVIAGLFVNERDFRFATSDMYRFDNLVGTLKALEELKQNKTKDGKLSLYDVLVIRPNALAVLCEGKYRGEFPWPPNWNPFNRIIERRLRMAIDRVGVLKTAIVLLEEMFSLPSVR